MRVKKLLISFCLIFTFLAPSAFADKTQILTGKEYFQITLKSIQQAKKSIIVAMYLVNVASASDENPVLVLVDSLIAARGRGVQIKVILDNSQAINYNAYNRLKQSGIEVYFDAPLKLLHAKVIIIDTEISIIGSHNWTRSALNDNLEVAAYIDDKEEAAKLTNYLSNIALSPAPAPRPKDQPGIRFPVEALTSLPKPPLFNLFTSQTRQAFDLYLYLVKKAQDTGSNSIPLDLDDFARNGLGYFNERPDIYQVLRKLDKLYGLILYKPQEKRIELIKIPSQSYSTIPDVYWSYGFDKKLSLSAKYVYLIALCESKASINDPYWFRSNKDLIRMYRISKNSIGKGLIELEKENIIEIYRDKPPAFGKFKERQANSYRLNLLQSPEQFQQGLKIFSQKYGSEVTQKARQLSEQLNEHNDLEKIEAYVQLINSYGYEKVKDVNSQVAAYRRETGFRDISQVILILKSNS